MKNSKLRKALAGLLGLGMAASMVFGTAGAVLADVQNPSFEKVYEEQNSYNGTGNSPAETFTFGTLSGDTATSGTASLTKVDHSSYTGVEAVPEDVKTITIGSATYAAGDASGQNKTKTVPLTIPAASVYAAPGHYTYEFKENAGTTAGVVYNDATYQVVVVVIYNDSDELEIQSVKLHRVSDGAKGAAISNTYESGRLTITKTVAGAMGDREKTFPVKVTLTAPEGKEVKSTVKVQGTEKDGTAVSTTDIYASSWTNGSVTRTYNVKDGTTITLTNIPAGVQYAVEEDRTDNTDYVPTYKLNSATYTANTEETVTKNTNDTVAITNTKDGTQDTGISASNMPYVLVLLAIGCAVAVYAAAKSRKKRA